MKKILHKSLMLSMALLFGVFASNGQGYTRVLSNPNASKEAVALYKYLLAMEGKVILSGQMGSSWGIDELAYLQTNTGKQPAIYGLDFITESDNTNEVTAAINYWRRGGIPTFMYHHGAPGVGEGYTASQGTVNFTNLFTPGSRENTDFLRELNVKSAHLQRLEDANVPVLWRPFHECSGTWFWWGKFTPAQFRQLWIFVYDYMVKTKGLNNLIWVLPYSGEPNGAMFPGNQYVDIGGADTYANNNSPQLALYNRTKGALGGNRMPIAFHEVGQIPDPNLAISQGAHWSWWMVWHTSYLSNMNLTQLKNAYSHAQVITLDEVPNIMAVYGVVTEVEESLDKKSVNMYPNPCKDVLNIDLPAANAELGIQVTIYSIDGTEVLSAQLSQASHNIINTSGLNVGLYVLKVKNNGAEITKKFSKVE